ncbi:MAG: YIP1 family protein [Candidatus Bilamarchaeaceae archaeon]
MAVKDKANGAWSWEDLLWKLKRTAVLATEKDFKRLTDDRDYAPSFAYYLVFQLAWFIIALLLYLVFGTLGERWLRLVLSIPIGIAVMYIYMGLVHGIIKLLGGKGSFLKTVQIYIYGFTPYYWLRATPCVGWMVGLLFSFGNHLLGLTEVHRLSYWKAAFAALVVPVAVAALALLALAFYFTAPMFEAIIRQGVFA